MSKQKIKPCPTCKNDEHIGVYSYDGWNHVECTQCDYLGPGEGSRRKAIKSHNDRCAASTVTEHVDGK